MKVILWLLGVGLCLCACSELNDGPPTLVSYELSLDSTENTITALDTLIFRANLEDDVSLESYILTVEAVNPTTLSTTSSLSDFNVNEPKTIAGRRLLAFSSNIIPSSARPGNYEFNFEFMDEAGFSGESISQDFRLINRSPEIQLDFLLPDTINFQASETFTLTGQVLTDYATLDSLKISLFRDTDSSRINLIQDLNAIPTNPFSFSSTYTFVVGDTGQYQLSFILSDVDSLSATLSSVININP
ncbi:MAG: DUF4625 domain-containing protein [Bacteroidota bacterium]